MAFCASCGTAVTDGRAFCPGCGRQVGAAPPAAAQPSAYYANPSAAPQYQQPLVSGSPGGPALDEAQAGKTMAILAYILFFIPLLTGDHKKNSFVRFHANQGLVLFLSAVAWGVLYGILMAVATAMLFNPYAWTAGGVGALGIVTTILGLLWLIPTVLCVIGIIHAARGELKPLPVIGRIRIIK
ncbi:MAG: DUF4870 domain-containing protein [Bifidobacteriaceae bacterium]|jgi:uncharacterized membrane protein|nr:DUF4870 domain-containing protein [Bifidobacteriaceae bacterium]